MFLVPLSPVSTAARRTPLRSPALSAVDSELSRFVDDTFARFFHSVTQAGPAPQCEAHSPAIDVLESDEAWTVQVDLPGVLKEDVKIAIDGKRVTLEAATPAATAQAPVAAEAGPTVPAAADASLAVAPEVAPTAAAADAAPAEAAPSDAAASAAPRVVYRERTVTRYARTLTLPSPVDAARSEAKMADGVLTLKLAKRVESQPAQINVL